MDAAGVAGLLQHDAAQALLLDLGADVLRDACGEVGHAHVDAHGLGAQAHHGEGLREEVRVEEGDAVGPAAVGAVHEEHGLGGGGGLVQQRGVGDVQAGEVLDHRLVVQEGLEAALGDLRLVRRVGRVPGRVLQHLAEDDARGDGVREALPDHLGLHDVAAGDLAQLLQDRGLGQRGGQLEGLRLADAGGDGGVHEGLERVVAQGLQHVLDVRGARADVAGHEGGRGGVLGLDALVGQRGRALGGLGAGHGVPPGDPAVVTAWVCSSPLCHGPESFRRPGGRLAPSVVSVRTRARRSETLSRAPDPTRYGCLRDSRGGFAPSAACSRGRPGQDARRRSPARGMRRAVSIPHV